MRLLVQWVLLVAAAIAVLQIDSLPLRYALLAVLAAALCVLLLMTVRSALAALLRPVLGRIRFSARERAIRRRDAVTESPLERALAAALEREGIAYVREYRISHTTVDFAFPDARLAVECDGWRYHHGRKKEDAKRDAFLRSKGWAVLRFPGERIRHDVAGCVREISGRL